MPNCLTCEHSDALHNSGGHCSMPGCACDELKLPEIAPDVDPPKPGACLHIMGEGAVWLVDEIAEVEEKLNDSSDFAHFTACDLEDVEGQPRPAFCTFPVVVRPQAVSSYHGFPQERWDRVLKATH